MNNEPVYVISVVSRMLQMHPQTLRKYERAGLVRPSRTDGMLRLYSVDDVQRLRLIKHLVDDLGLNLAGVDLFLGLRDRMEQLRQHLEATDERSVEDIDEELNELLATLERNEVQP
jgi:MerR family transcriptional regulator, heat shock protein HspR